jgi:UDP-N-acetylmuramoylalanine--D-glutamate ligase
MRICELIGKKVAIWGLGKEGWSTLKTLNKALPSLRINILNDNPLPVGDVERVEKDYIATISTGPDAIANLSTFDVVIKSPGISIYRQVIKDARAKGVLFTSATNLWFSEHAHENTICITGTKGKSTTASLVTHLLQNSGMRVELRGNIGDPLIDSLDISEKPDFWVIEISSFQLADFEGSPSVSVLLNLFPEHLDWHGDQETYFRDKLNLFSNMHGGTIILNRLDELSVKLAAHLSGVIYFNDADKIHYGETSVYDGDTPLINCDKIHLRGNHNLSNICAALSVIKAVGISPQACVQSLTYFRELPHRLNVVGEKDGIVYVDDSISTVQESTIEAIKSFAGRPITLLLGGFDRGHDYGKLVDYLLASRLVANVVTMPTTGLRIAAALSRQTKGLNAPALYEAENLDSAIKIARRITPSGGIVLLSPAAPSFGAFKNFEERGDKFTQIALSDIR